MVTQDTSLLHRSVRDNILYGRPDAGEAAAIAAAKKAQADDFIAGLEDLKGRKAYSAHVGERGVKLSGGQRQRVAIARVLLKDAPILILDEATSALNSEVEQAIQEQLYNLMAGKTVIAIAHRLSTIAAMDRLVIMDQGRIVEEGSHDGCWRTAGSMRTCGRGSRAASSPSRWRRRSRGAKPLPRVELANGWRRAKLKRARRIGGKQGCMSRRTTNILKAVLSALHYSGADSMIAPFTRGIGAIFMLHHVSPEKPSSFEPNRILKVTPRFPRAGDPPGARLRLRDRLARRGAFPPDRGRLRQALRLLHLR